jgi:hypothetical protein
MGSGCAFLDFDGDGWLDIFLVNGRPLASKSGPPPTAALYRNNGDGGFTDVTRGSGLDVPLYGMGCAVGDYDADGLPDLYVTCALEKSRLFRNLGEGKFQDVTVAAGVDNGGKWGTSCAWLDYDRDGRLDLFVANYLQFSADDAVPCLRGGRPIYCGPAAYRAESCRLYRNLGNGRFSDVSDAAGIGGSAAKSLGVLTWDVDGDGFVDVVVANDVTPNYLFRNTGQGRFTEEGVPRGVAFAEDGTARAGMGIDAADIANNGVPAILISNFAQEPNTLLQRLEDGTFQDTSYQSGLATASIPMLGFGLLFLDGDNDGWKDALVVNGHIEPDVERFEAPITHAQPALLFLNAAGTFSQVTSQVAPSLANKMVARGLARGDYDGDGDLDLLVTTNNGSARLFRNTAPPRNHWVALRLLDAEGKGDALGASVVLRTGDLVQTDQVRSGSSYLSASDTALHFGLGAHTRVDSIEVRWPSPLQGVSRWTGLPGDHAYVLRPGDTRATPLQRVRPSVEAKSGDK